MSRTARDTILRLSPPWLVEWVGSRLLYSMAAQLDTLGDRLVQGIRSSEPEYAAEYFEEALAPIGRDRQIRRGFDEPAAAYAARLIRWLDSWAYAGSAFAVMDQVRGYLSGHEVTLRVINNTGGAWRTVSAAGEWLYHRANPTNWNWSDEPAKVSRNWLIIYPPASLWTVGPTVGDPALWGGAVGTPGYTVGSTATPNQVADLRAIVDTFKGAHSKYEAIVLAFDPASFDPEAAPGSAGMPDGGWQYQTTNTGDPATAARLSTARYIRGF